MTRACSRMIVLLSLLLPGAIEAQTFRDPSLQTAVEVALGHPAADWTPEELLSLTVLDATNRGIVDLDGIESLANLVALDLADNQVADLSPLSSLTSLTHLSLERNQVTDLSPLAPLSHLQVLLLLGNQVSDLAPLLGLPALVEVDVRDNPLNLAALEEHVPTLTAHGLKVMYDPPSEGTTISDTGWVMIGPTHQTQSSWIRKLVAAPSAPEVLYAVSNYGLYLSRNDGADWERTGLVIDPSKAYAMSVAVDAVDPATVYDLADGLRSSDWGVHWQSMSIPGETSPLPSALTGDPVQGGRLYCYTYDLQSGPYIAISDDGGRTWRGTEMHPRGWEFSVSRHPADRNAIYLSGMQWNEQGARMALYYQSEDSGLTWRALSWPQDFETVVGDPADSVSFYAIRKGLVFHSSNAGITWDQIADLGVIVYNSLAVHPLDASWLLAWASNRAAQSHDGGRTWERLTFQPWGMQFHPADPMQAFVFTDSQALRTRDRGATWNPVTLIDTVCTVPALAMDAAGTLYAGTHRDDSYMFADLQRSTDNGANWEGVEFPEVKNGEITMVYPNPDDADLLLAYPGSGTSFYRSEDHGQHWQAVVVGDEYGSYDPNQSEVYATGPDRRTYYLLQPYSRALYRSDDAAATWVVVNDRPISHLAVHPTNERILFAVSATGSLEGNDGELLRSDDGGITWDTFRNGDLSDSTVAIAITPKPPHRLLALTTQTFYDCGLTADEGCVTQPAPRPVLSADLSGAFLRCDPVSPSSLYLVLPHEIWSTRDAGETWQRLAFGPAAAPYFTDLVVSPQNPSMVFVSTPWGVYRAAREQVTAVSATPGAAPVRCSLAQNYPNPFNARTTIVYQLPARRQVSLVIYDVLGRPMRRLVSSEQEAGEHRLIWDGRDDQGREVGSGVYLGRLVAGGGQRVVRLVLVR